MDGSDVRGFIMKTRGRKKKGGGEREKINLVVLVRRLPPVADNVQSSDDFTNGEETNDLSGSDADESEFLGGRVTDAGQDVLGRENTLRGVAGNGEEVLVVRLEGDHVAIQVLVVCLLSIGNHFDRRRDGGSHGGVMFWPRKTSLPSSNPTFE